jgi:hypothetical protein
MVWNLQFPRAEFRTPDSAIELELETRLRCILSDRSTNQASQSDAEGASPANREPCLALTIVPSEASLPINIDFPPCGDAYVRESDLIALYPQQYPWPFGYQADFRYRDDLPGGVHALELWLSVSTSMLECNPKLHLIPETQVKLGAVREIAIATHGRSALIVHPLDVADCEPVLAGDFDGVGHWDVFGGFMEKGVIRRSRFLCAWSNRQEPSRTWEHVLDWFSQSPLPLTA